MFPVNEAAPNGIRIRSRTLTVRQERLWFNGDERRSEEKKKFLENLKPEGYHYILGEPFIRSTNQNH
jgi:hypothetical protein